MHKKRPSDLPKPFPLRFERFVKRLLSTPLLVLNFTVLLLEPTSLLFARQHLFHKCLLPIPIRQPRAVKLRRAFDERTNLRILRHLELPLFLVHSLRVENGTHVEEL